MFKKALDGAQTQERGAVSEENDSVQCAISDEEEIEPDELTQYNRFGWIRKNNIMSVPEWRNHNSRLKMHADAGNTESLNADGDVILQTRDDNGSFGLITVSDNKPTYPTINRVYRIKWRDEPYWSEEAEEEIWKSEQRWGYDAQLVAQKYVELGAVEIYNAQDYRAYKLDEIPGRMDSDGETSDRDPSDVRNGDGRDQETGRGRLVNNENVQRSIDDSVLPDDDYLLAEIEEWKRGSGDITSEPLTSKTGERQFATKTIQQNAYIPDYIKQTFLNDPARREYSRESNMEQLARG